MRIAYITPYQGRTLKDRRPITLNRSLAGSAKMEVISRLLREGSYEVEIFSQGEVVELALKFYPGFTEPVRFHPDIPVTYSSALPVKFINGFWQGFNLLSLFKTRHRAAPFDLVLIYNLKVAQVACAEYAMQQLGLPVVLEYEDDNFLDTDGKPNAGMRPGYVQRARNVMSSVAAGMACSPHLLDQLPAKVPRLMVRGVVSEDIVRASGKSEAEKKNWVLFSGTHYRTKGIAPLMKAWPLAKLTGWELHITGEGEETEALKKLAAGRADIIFHGMVSMTELAQLMSLAKITINPHDLSRQPGNVFAFKIIEYLAAGSHVVSTPMGALEKEIAAGITFMPDNTPETIARTLQEVVQKNLWRQTAQRAVHETYRPDALRVALDKLMREAAGAKTAQR
ncbi:MAG TPA: glycosyltransferase [Verrucomicrobiae bacterium]|jgi:glycosyltransferase involved in cell wall biosynthesis|nr:glycosyltransferase [Verrucomicrobiae bacterium]